MGIFLIIVLLIVLLWPWIMKWLQRLMAHRAEDMLRKMAGQPTRKEERRQKRRNARNESSTPPPYKRRQPEKSASEILNDVAEDVEFTEIHDYSEDTIDIGSGPNKNRRIYRESQVEDASYTEVKINHRTK